MGNKKQGKKDHVGVTQFIYHFGIFLKEVYQWPFNDQKAGTNAWNKAVTEGDTSALENVLSSKGVDESRRKGVIKAVMKHHKLGLYLLYRFYAGNVENTNTVQAAPADQTLGYKTIGDVCSPFQNQTIPASDPYSTVAGKLSDQTLVERMINAVAGKGVDVNQSFESVANRPDVYPQLCSSNAYIDPNQGGFGESLSRMFDSMSSLNIDDIASSLNNAATAAYGAFAAAAVVAYVGKSVVEVYNGLTGFGAVSIKEAVTVRVKTVAEPLKQIAAGYMHKPLGLSLKSA